MNRGRCWPSGKRALAEPRGRLVARLFAYGTLKPIARQRGGRPAHVWGRMWDNGSYPAIRLTEPGDGHLVAGLVFEVRDDDLAEFDRMEGVAHGWYRRVRVTTVEGEEVWVYEGKRCLSSLNSTASTWRPVPSSWSRVVAWMRVGPWHRATSPLPPVAGRPPLV